MRVNVPYKVIAVFGPDPVGDNGKDEVRYKCPECINRKGTPDTKGHLYVNVKNLKFHCVRCEYAGSLSHIKVDSSKAYQEDMDHQTEELAEEMSQFINNDDSEFRFKIPIDKVTVSSAAVEYLLGRGFTYDQIEYYDLRVGNLNQEFGRIIIPNQVKDLVYTDMYSARSYIDQEPKYSNPYDVNKSHIVFNLHRIKEGSTIILVEGALTAIAAGYHAVATYGKNLSKVQASLIAKKKPKVIYVNYDFGAEKESYEACKLLSKYCPEAEIREVLMISEKDAADLTKEEYVKCLEDAKLYNPLVSQMEDLL